MDLTSKVVTCDAINTQKDLTKIITSNKGHYVMPIKEKHKCFYEDIKLYFEKSLDKINVLCEKEIDKQSSKIVIREYYLTNDINWCLEIEGWSNIQGFGMAHKTTKDLITGEIVEDNRYYISSFNDSVKLFSKAVKNHWSVEVMHRDLDMYFDDDENTTKKSNALLNFNILKKVVLSILKLVQGFYGDHFSKNRIRKRLSYGFGKEIESIFKSISYLIEEKKPN